MNLKFSEARNEFFFADSQPYNSHLEKAQLSFTFSSLLLCTVTYRLTKWKAMSHREIVAELDSLLAYVRGLLSSKS